MGIYKLIDLIKNHAPNSTRTIEIQNYSYTTVAIDASLYIYETLFPIAINQMNSIGELTDSHGNRTTHLLGMFQRTIFLLENNIKPLWVFDASSKNQNDESNYEEKNEENLLKEIDKLSLDKTLPKMRHKKVSDMEIEDAKKMLDLMGIPVIESQAEAEAECSYLNKTGKVDAVVSSSLDPLIFGTKKLLRFSRNLKEELTEINKDKILEELSLNEDEFIDLCILCGSNYTSKIGGMTHTMAYDLIKENKTIEKVIDFCLSENLKEPKFKIPTLQEFDFQRARENFKKPQIHKEVQLKWSKKIDSAPLIQFLCLEKGFSKDRVQNGIKKVETFIGNGTQKRLEDYFGAPFIKKSTVGKKQETVITPKFTSYY